MENQIDEQQKQAIAIIDKVFMISLFLQRTGNQRIAKFGLNQPQFAVLGEIARHKDLAQKDILGEYLLKKSNLSKIIKKLEMMKLITIGISQADRRKMVLNATERGSKIYNQCMKDLNEMKLLFTASLSGSEIQTILIALNKLQELVNEQKNKKRK